MQRTETTIRDHIEELKNNAKGKINKQVDPKSEVLKYYNSQGIPFGMWIMGFENTGARAKPIEFKELLFMIDLPKAFFNKKLVIIVKKMQIWLNSKIDSPSGYLRLGPVFDIQAL